MQSDRKEKSFYEQFEVICDQTQSETGKQGETAYFGESGNKYR